MSAEQFQVSKIPNHVVRCIVDYMVENCMVADAGAARATMHLYSERELIDMYLVWNGIVNWTDTILQAVDGVRAAKNG